MSLIFRRCLIVSVFGVCLLMSGVAQNFITKDQLLGQLNTVTTAVPFLLIAPDSKAGSMGDGGVASSPDANSIHWNPAKLAFVKDNMGVSISYIPWLRALVPDINLSYLGWYKKINNEQTLGASLRYFSLGDITFTDNVGNIVGNYRPNEFAVDLAYSRKLSDYFSGGLALRFINSNLTGNYSSEGTATHPGTSVAADISAYYEREIELSERDAVMAYGLNISNIGTKISYTESAESDFIPINLRLGGSLAVELDEYNKVAIIAEINKLLVPTNPVYDSTGNGILYGYDSEVSIARGIIQSFYDAPGGFKEEMREYNLSIGAEYWYDQQFAIRAGYFYEHPFKGNRQFLSVGAGLKYNVFGIDFSYLVPMNKDFKSPLENTLRFTLLFDFEGLKGQDGEESKE